MRRNTHRPVLKNNITYFDWRDKTPKSHAKKKVVPIQEAIFTMASATHNLKPGIITTLLLMNLMFATVVSGHQEQTSSDRELTDLINKRVTYDSSAGLTQKMCRDVLTDQIGNTLAFFPHSKPSIMRTLRNKEFRIVCSTRASIKKNVPDFDGDGHPAFFSPSMKTIYLPIDKHTDPQKTDVHLAAYNHEFMHAEDFFSHDRKPCYQKEELHAIAPVEKYSLKNLKIYNDQLDLGDKRIKQFGKLLMKQRDKQHLSSKDQALLNKFVAACQNCFLPNVTATFTTTAYQEVVADGWKKGKKGFQYTTPSGSIMEIIDISPASSGYYTAKMRPIDSAQLVLIIPDRIELLLKKQFKNDPPSVRLAERNTHTFEYLSESALQTFYPEAYEARQNYLNKCFSDNEESSKLKLDL